MRKRKKISTGFILGFIIICVSTLYLSYWFYTNQSEKKNEPITKVSSIDFLSIDSIKNDVSMKYQSQIDQLKIDIKKCQFEKDTLINKKDSIFFELKKDYDSVVIRLDNYKQRLREINQQKDTINKSN